MSPRLRTAVLRGPADKIPAWNVATAPRNHSAGPSRQIPGARCRNAPARPLRGAIATKSRLGTSPSPRTAALRKVCDAPRDAANLRIPPIPAFPPPAEKNRGAPLPKFALTCGRSNASATGKTPPSPRVLRSRLGGEWAERESPYRRLQFSSNGNTQKYYNWEETRDKSTPERPQAWSLCQ